MEIQIIGIGTTQEQEEALAKAIEDRTGIKPTTTGKKA